MSLRIKLLLMLSTFLVLIAIFAGGTLLIFEKMSGNVTALNDASDEQRLYVDLKNNISDFLEIVRNFGFTGNRRFKNQYHPRLAGVYKSFGEVATIVDKKKELDDLGDKFQNILSYSKTIVESRYPVGNADVRLKLEALDVEGREIISALEKLHEGSMKSAISIAEEGEEIKRNMVYYLLLLIVFSSIAAVYLVISVRRAISGPFNELMKATEKIGKGDLSYRIEMRRRDELGIIAKRFDSMVGELELSNRKIEHKLNETELLLDVAKIAGTTLDLKDALYKIVRTITSKLRHESCTIYLIRPEVEAFCLESSTDSVEDMADSFISLKDELVQEIINTLGHVLIPDTGEYPESNLRLIRQYRSMLAVPIIHDDVCRGILMVRNKAPQAFSDDDINTLKILSHTVYAIVRNAELFQSTKLQLQKLSVLYELTRAVTSVLDLEELLRRIAKEISRLLFSKGCIIRLVEKDKLKIKSYFGLPTGVKEEMELSLGKGIAGWVAEKGKPLLVEDVSKMPEDMRVPVLDVRSVICVPLKVGEDVIGTLGLYDKYDNEGNIVPFNVDDLNTAEGFASVSAITIEKSKMYEDEVIRKKKASDEKKRLDILFNSVQGGIITIDRDFTVNSVNKYIENWMNMKEEELVGNDSVDLFHDKVGICPHCAAKPTFETGEINSIMQSRGVNYAELTAYPIKNEFGEIVECVVFIMDITERVLYQEETLSLYREVIQTKEYMESLIDNSADAIVTSDTEGLIKSWNQAAEKIYGYRGSEVIGKYLPFVPESLVEKENKNIQKIKRGEVLKNVETFRQRKDGSIIEVSLTLSPIKDAAGTAIGISGISRDITEKKNVENELIRRNQELSRLFFISSAMRSTLELDKLLRMVLAAVSMSDGLGFNRSMLFLVDENNNVIKGAMGVGPESPEDAWKIWDDISLRQRTLDHIIQDIIANPIEKDSFLDKLAMRIEIPLDDDTVLTRAVKGKIPLNVKNVLQESATDVILIQQLGTEAFAVVPLISRDKVIGLLWVDNYFNRQPITDEDIKFLTSFSNQIASAIENARLFEKVALAEQRLENIFESISDMVYFNSKDYVIQSINRAVSERLGLPPDEIIGKKCYEVFHGTKGPFQRCPHHKTVVTKEAYIEEFVDPYLGGTFLSSSSPIFDSSGEFIGSVHVVRDITEIMSLREKLITAEKMAALGEVAAKVAHEIRNPLVSIGGFAKRLGKKLDGNLREYAEIIVKEVDRLEEILKEILGFVREARLSKEEVNLNELIEDVYRLMKSDIEDREIEMIRDLKATIPVFIDSNRVKEAIVNILSNSIQSFLGRGTIYVRTYELDENVVVEIEDTGGGIPRSELPFIFNPFFTTKSSGTGLGLAITNRIIQEHNGWVEVESEENKGTIFKIYLQIKEG
jgi:PAS domain S-box-containing protein